MQTPVLAPKLRQVFTIKVEVPGKRSATLYIVDLAGPGHLREPASVDAPTGAGVALGYDCAEMTRTEHILFTERRTLRSSVGMS